MRSRTAPEGAIPDPTDVATLVEAVRETHRGAWLDLPRGWPGEIEAAVVDAVMSIRATYGRPGTGVRAAVARWRAHRGGGLLDDLSRLAAVEPEFLADVLGNRQRLAGNALKTAGIVEAATRLVAVGARASADLRADSTEQREAVTGVTGLGPLTWGYLTLLLDVAHEPADARIVAFVGECVGRELPPGQAHDMLAKAAVELGTSPVGVTHAIWRHVRSRASRSPAPQERGARRPPA